MCKDADSYLSLARLACSHTPIPVIASLNGECSDNWLEFAAELETAGVDAVELYVRNPPPGEYEDPREVEEAIIDTARKFNETNDDTAFYQAQPKLYEHRPSFPPVAGGCRKGWYCLVDRQRSTFSWTAFN